MSGDRYRTRVAFHTLGCPKNEVDSDHMRARLLASGYRLTGEVGEADVVVLNTCAFIADAVDESIEEALDLAREAPALVVAGCLPSRYGEDLERALTEADAFVPVADEHRIADVVGHVSGHAPEPEPASADMRTEAGPSAYLHISEGCSRSCAYCTIPAIRGPHRSASPERLLAEARELAARGAREIVLVGQDTSAYGSDLDERTDPPTLTRRLALLEGIDWVRVMYVQPHGVTDPLLGLIAETPEVCEYLDMPLQHASRSVLRSMGRAGDADSFLDLLERLRSDVPGISLRSTFIAGHPGETEEDVETLAEFLRETRLDHAGVFAYSPEEGTVSYDLPGLPSEGERLARARYLAGVADDAAASRAADRVGSVVDVLVEGTQDGEGTVGRTRGQAPVVDGVVHIDERVTPGSLVRVRIDGSAGHELFGGIVR